MKIFHIDNQQDLNHICQDFAKNQWLAVDTEFIREKTYFAQLCLIQVCNGQVAVSIDPLNIADLTPLKKLFSDPNIEKIFHASHQDLEIFYFLWETVPQPIFDTQISAALLGYGNQIGYANLVEKLTQIKLNKGYTRANWHHRPLSQAMLDYALDDVIYLAEIYLIMRQTLIKNQQLDWLAADFKALSENQSYQIQPEKAWRKIKGRKNLSKLQLAVLQQCAIWRENLAMAKNLPKSWLISNPHLLLIAVEMPAEKRQLRALLNGVSNAYIDIIFDLIQKTKTMDEADYPVEKDYQKPTPSEQKQIKKLQQYLNQYKETQFNTLMMPSKKHLLSLVRGKRDLKFLKGWQYKAFGETLLKINT